MLIADRQTAGRGRMGRDFHSPGAMGIYMSVILRYPVPPHRLMHLTCAAAAAMCEAVENAAGLRPEIKWVNDLVCRQKKLAGILTELVLLPEQTCAVVGIGINCCQQPEDFDPAIRDMAISLSVAAGGPVSRAKVAAAMIESLWRMDTRLLSEKAAILDSYRRSCVTLGKDIRLLASGEARCGHALDIDEDGGLVVRFSDGHTESVQAGEVSVRGMYGYLS